MSPPIVVVVCRVGALPEVETLPSNDTLKRMQAIVGGYVDCLAIGAGFDLWCNDEGLLRELPVNNALGPQMPIRGDFLIARHDDLGNTVGLSDDDIAQILATFDRERVLAADRGDEHMTGGES